ncbi:MAG TPA: tetratricopeptide repeat protein [Candidatus Xenobia bacterium]|nr:tetratricopeptide repeat protein [Candidatus Xenobia bacterium]
MLLLIAVPASADTAYEVSVDASPQLFAVLCAARAGGLIGSLGAPGDPVAAQVEASLAQLDPKVVEPLRAYFREKYPNPSPRFLSTYISMALVLNPPPEWGWALPRDQLPPDVWDAQEFQPLLRAFYEQAGLERLWAELRPAYERTLERLQPQFSQTLFETRAYLRSAGEQYLGRAYAIYVDALLPPGLVSARNYGEHYFLALPPGHSDFLSAARHQYLHYVLDPLMAKHADRLKTWNRVLPVAAQAPRLPAEFRRDTLLLATECLIQAMELRLRHLPEEEAEAELAGRERSGYVFVRFFFASLQRYEQSEPSLRYYFPDLLAGYNTAHEQARLARIQFDPAEATSGSAGAPTARDQATAQLLSEGQRLYQAGDHEGARKAFAQVLQGKPDEPGALFGLALVASAEENRSEAKEYFERVLKTLAPADMAAWTHVYLGRIYDLEGDRKEAIGHYRAALALDTRVDRVEQAARRGLERPFGQDEKPGPQ